MGARTSIQFKNKEEKSVILFSHWGGEEFKRQAELYVIELKNDIFNTKKNLMLKNMPLGRLEPNTVMVDFIRDVTRELDRVDGDLYLGATENDGDNSDYGHHIINLTETT